MQCGLRSSCYQSDDRSPTDNNNQTGSAINDNNNVNSSSSSNSLRRFQVTLEQTHDLHNSTEAESKIKDSKSLGLCNYFVNTYISILTRNTYVFMHKNNHNNALQDIRHFPQKWSILSKYLVVNYASSELHITSKPASSLHKRI
jgi:hypothetical protein